MPARASTWCARRASGCECGGRLREDPLQAQHQCETSPELGARVSEAASISRRGAPARLASPFRARARVRDPRRHSAVIHRTTRRRLRQQTRGCRVRVPALPEPRHRARGGRSLLAIRAQCEQRHGVPSLSKARRASTVVLTCVGPRCQKCSRYPSRERRAGCSKVSLGDPTGATTLEGHEARRGSD